MSFQAFIMQEEPPDFFLSSREHRGDWARARACWLKEHLKMQDGRECVLVEISPPVNGQKFGLGDKDITSLLLVNRWKTNTFGQQVDRVWPVLIYRMPSPLATTQTTVRDSDVTLTAWG